MKTVKIIHFFCLVLMLSALSCSSQKNLVTTLYESKNKEEGICYTDSSGHFYYSWDSFGGVLVDVVFINAEFDVETKHLKIEGRTIEKDRKDTFGFCCVDYFIARPVNGYLTNIRELGQTNNPKNNDKSKPAGYFSFNVLINSDDRLYIKNEMGGGLQEFLIGKVFSKNFITKRNE